MMNRFLVCQLLHHETVIELMIIFLLLAFSLAHLTLAWEIMHNSHMNQSFYASEDEFATSFDKQTSHKP